MQHQCLLSTAMFPLQVKSYMFMFAFLEQARGLRMLRQQLGAASMVTSAAAVCDGFAMTGRIETFAGRLVSCAVEEATAWGEAMLRIWLEQDSVVRAEQPLPPQHWDSTKQTRFSLKPNIHAEIADKLGDERCRGSSGWKAAGNSLVEHVSCVAQLAHQFGAVYALAGPCRHIRGLEPGRYTMPRCHVKGCFSTGIAALLCRLLAELGQVAAASPPGLDGSEGMRAERRSLCDRFRLAVSAMLQVRSSPCRNLSDRRLMNGTNGRDIASSLPTHYKCSREK